MANPAVRTADTASMIEEQVDTGLRALLDGYRPAYNPIGDKKDDLLKRFTLFPNQRLPDFDHPFAKAFAATDEFNTSRQMYAMVCENNIPYRHQAIQSVLGATSPHITSLLGAGVVHCSHLSESRYVLFMEKPAGVRLSELMKTQPRLHEHKIIDFVLQPVVRGLLALREKQLSHGNICPASLFIGAEQSVLAECYSLPCGTMQHYLYKPMERQMCDPLGYGEASEQTDVYALGIMAYELLYGLDRFRNIEQDDFIKLAMNLTTYQLFANNREFSDAFQDFFRGTMNDNPSERWGIDQVMQWLGGKRFNMIAPVPPKEAARPFTFGGENFFSRRLLAHAFHRNWREATKDIKHMKLERWCETSLHRPEMAERIERALRIAGEASTERHVSDMMTRIIAILDPTGPLRSLSLSLRPDAIGLILASLMDQTDQPEFAQIINMVDTDVSSFWLELSEANRSTEMSQTLWKLQRDRAFIKNTNPGFGIERLLYDMNPSLPCQSNILKQYHITTVIDALHTLDAIATHLAPDTSFMDRHLAAFIASRIDMGKDVKMHDFAAMPSLMNNQELRVLKILARAQQKADKKDNLELVGLCAWAGMRLEKMIDEIHNRVLRKRLKLQLRKLASTGNLNDLLNAVLNREIATRDYEGFTRAIALHEINHKRIEKLENQRLLDHMAAELGGRMSTMISYVILVLTAYFVISGMLGF